MGQDISLSVHTGDQLMQGLKENSSEANPITRLSITSHGYDGGLAGNWDHGFYDDSWFSNWSEKADADDLSKFIKKGAITFAKDSTISFVGCNTANGDFLKNVSKAVPQSYVIGADQRASAIHETLSSGRKIDGKRYQTEFPTGRWFIYKNGQEVGKLPNRRIDPTLVNPKNHLYEK